MARSTVLSGVRMSNTRLSMRQIKEVLRLRFVCERSQHEIAATIGASRSTVWEYLDRVRRAQLNFEQAMAMDDAQLEALLFPPAPPSRCPQPMISTPRGICIFASGMIRAGSVPRYWCAPRTTRETSATNRGCSSRNSASGIDRAGQGSAGKWSTPNAEVACRVSPLRAN